MSKETRVESYRDHARYLRECADRAVYADLRHEMLSIAEQFERLANEVEGYIAFTSPPRNERAPH